MSVGDHCDLLGPAMNAPPTSFWRCAAIGNAGLTLALAGVWLWMGLQGLFWRADFSAFYTGWSMVLDGRGDRLYDLDLQARYQERLLPERPSGATLLPFVHPPQAAVAMSGLALLPRPAAFALWAAVQLGLCLLASRFLLRLLADLTPAARALALGAALAFPPLFMTFQMGQVTLWCVVCLLGFVLALKEDRPFALAAWLLLGSVKPQLMVVPFLVLLAMRQWRALGWLAALSLPLLALTSVVLGPECWADYLILLRTCTQQFGTSAIDPAVMYNVKGVFTTALGGHRGELVNSLSAAAFLAGLLPVLALWRGNPTTTPHFDARLALALLVGALVNPHVNPTDALAIVPPAALFAAHLARQDARSARAFAVLAVLCPFLFLIDCYLVNPARLGGRPFVLLWLGVCGWIGFSLLRGSGGQGYSGTAFPVAPKAAVAAR